MDLLSAMSLMLLLSVSLTEEFTFPTRGVRRSGGREGVDGPDGPK